MTSKFERAVDAAIAAENRRFLADPAAVRAAEEEGDRYRLQLEAEGVLPREPDAERAGFWTITTERAGFEYEEPAAEVLAEVEGHQLDRIIIQGPGNRALAITIELGEPGWPVAVRVTEDGYGYRQQGEVPPRPALRWLPASDGGEAVKLPVSRADLEEVR